MTRIVIALMIAVVLASCTSEGGTGDEGAEQDAQSVKREMDAAAKELLPDLVGEVGGELSGMQATFHERSGFGIWDYEAVGSIQRPPGTMVTALDAASSALERHDFSVVRDEAQKRVTGTRGNVRMIVQAGLLSDEAKVSSLQVSIGTIDTVGDDDDFAENAPPVDYLDYLK